MALQLGRDTIFIPCHGYRRRGLSALLSFDRYRTVGPWSTVIEAEEHVIADEDEVVEREVSGSFGATVEVIMMYHGDD